MNIWGWFQCSILISRFWEYLFIWVLSVIFFMVTYGFFIWLFSELFSLFPTSAANKLVSVVFKRQISFPWPIKTLIPSKFYLKLSSIVRIEVLFFSLFKSKSKLVFLGASFEKLWLFDFNLCMILQIPERKSFPAPFDKLLYLSNQFRLKQQVPFFLSNLPSCLAWNDL